MLGYALTGTQPEGITHTKALIHPTQQSIVHTVDHIRHARIIGFIDQWGSEGVPLWSWSLAPLLRRAAGLLLASLVVGRSCELSPLHAESMLFNFSNPVRGTNAGSDWLPYGLVGFAGPSFKEGSTPPWGRFLAPRTFPVRVVMVEVFFFAL